MPCLSSGLPGVKPSAPLSTRNQVGPPGRVGEDRVAVGDAAVADPLLAAADPVADDLAVLLDRHRRGRERARGRCRPGARWRRRRRSARARPARRASRPSARGSPPTLIGSVPRKVARTPVAIPRSMRGHGLGHPVDVVGPPAEAAELLRDGQEVEADLPRVVEVLHDLLGEVVAELDLQQLRDREVLLRVLPERREDLVQHLGVESRHEAPCELSGTRRGLAGEAEGRPRP